MRKTLLSAVLLSALAAICTPARADEKDDAAAPDEAALKAFFLKTDGPALVEFLQTRARGGATHESVAKMVARLDAKDALDRQKAVAELIAVGAPAVPLLRQASRDADRTEFADLARRLWTTLETDAAGLPSAAVRLLALRKPEGAAEAVMAYLPHADGDAVGDEIRAALTALAYDKNEPSAVLVKALASERPAVRAMAATALCANPNPRPRDGLRGLLGDKVADVRFRAAMGLAAVNDPKAVSALILLLVDLPLKQAQEAEGVLRGLSGEIGPKDVAVADDDAARTKARDAWAKWWLDTEGPGLLDEYRNRTLTEADAAAANTLIEKLGAESFADRKKAEAGLIAMKAKILPLLRQAEKNDDLEIRNRAAACAAAIAKDAPLSDVTVRLTALRRPKGAAGVLLDYMPFADDEMIDDLQSALNTVAFAGDKLDPAVTKALADKAPARRAAAGAVLAAGPKALRGDARKMLADKDVGVRVRVGLALANAMDEEAVPVLIAAVGDGNAEQSAAAEGFLAKLSREAGPKDLPDGFDVRGKRSAAWKKWWDDNKGKVAMLDPTAPNASRHLGYLLVVHPNNGMIFEWDRQKKERWKMTGLSNPWDAQVLPSGDRVLVTEQGNQRITEREIKSGKILRTINVVNDYPFSAEQLPNGRVLVVSRMRVTEYDRAGKSVFEYARPENDIMSARRLRDGRLVVVVQRNNEVLHLDPTGKKVIKRFNVGQIATQQNTILDNGNVLIPQTWMNVLVEYDKDGKELWRLTINNPMCAERLPNGNTLVASQSPQNRIVEFDKAKKQIGEKIVGDYTPRIRLR